MDKKDVEWAAMAVVVGAICDMWGNGCVQGGLRDVCLMFKEQDCCFFEIEPVSWRNLQEAVDRFLRLTGEEEEEGACE